jgi:hypothetical protein
MYWRRGNHGDDGITSLGIHISFSACSIVIWLELGTPSSNPFVLRSIIVQQIVIQPLNRVMRQQGLACWYDRKGVRLTIVKGFTCPHAHFCLAAESLSSGHEPAASCPSLSFRSLPIHHHVTGRACLGSYRLHIGSHRSHCLLISVVDNFAGFYVTRESRDSSVGIALGYGLYDRGSKVRFSAGLGIFLFTTAFRTALGSTQPPI